MSLKNLHYPKVILKNCNLIIFRNQETLQVKCFDNHLTMTHLQQFNGADQVKITHTRWSEKCGSPPF